MVWLLKTLLLGECLGTTLKRAVDAKGLEGKRKKEK